MSRRSSRASSIAAAARISDTAKDDDDAARSENEFESPPRKPGVLKGTETNDDAAIGTIGKSAKKKAPGKKKKKKSSPKKKAATDKGKAKAAKSDDESDSEPEGTKKAGKEKGGKKKEAKKKESKEKASPKKASPEKDSPKKRKKGKGGASDDDDATPAKKSKKSPQKKTTAKKKKAADHQRWTERTPLARHWDPERDAASGSSDAFTVVSWNVAGLRAFVRKRPDALSDLARRHRADVICLQETKLQDGHLDDPKLKLREYFDEKLEGYDGHWSYSKEKKGYSGTAMFIKRRRGGAKKEKKMGVSMKGKKQATLGAFLKSSEEGEKDSSAEAGDDAPHLVPINVDTELGLPAHDGEGRAIIAEFPLFYLTNVYVPNSGQKLDRLGYRTDQWDIDLLKKMQQLEKEGEKPVVWLGDLNVAHGEKDTWNEGAKHLSKSAGTTAEERASFERQLGAGYVDAFRCLHPEGRGHYSYWSQRAGNREPNKGLRLDYFICSNELMECGEGKKACVRDSYMLPEELGSDHCPIVLEMEIKK